MVRHLEGEILKHIGEWESGESMTAIDETYRAKRMTADQAVALVPSGARLAMPMIAAEPPALLAALAARARAGEVRDLHLYYMLSAGIAWQSVLAPDLAAAITPVSIFHGGVERALDAARAQAGVPAVDFLPCNFHQVPRLLCEHVGVDTLLVMAAPMDADGNFSLGVSTDYVHAVAHRATRVLLEVNPNMPRVRGQCQVPLSRVTAVVEHASPLAELPQAPRTPADQAIGRIIAGLTADGACLQMGIGALPDAVCAELAHHRHLGIHTEMMPNGLAALIQSGAVDNSRKQTHAGVSIFTFALGDRALYAFLDDNPGVEAYPVSYVNDPCVIARNDNVLSVNATMQVDLSGACNSEFMGGRQYSGIGGQVDFVRGAYASRGGKSIIACHSTAAGGTVSRICLDLSGPVTTARTDIHMVATEFGCVQLKGLSLDARARALIGIAHPDFREDLERGARERRILSRTHFPAGAG